MFKTNNLHKENFSFFSLKKMLVDGGESGTDSTGTRSPSAPDSGDEDSGG